MAVVEIPLAKLGLLAVPDAAARLGRSVRGVQKLIQGGRLPAVVVSGGKRAVYLIRLSDLAAFTPPTRGRPPGGGAKRAPRGRKARP